MQKKKRQYYASIILCAFAIVGSVIILFRDSYFKLKDQNATKGRVVDSGISYYTTGSRYKVTKRVFYAKLDNSVYQFAIFRDYEGYDDLKQTVKPGDSLVFYYRHSSDKLNKNVFQMEKGAKILFGAQEYKDRSATVAALTFMIGVGMLVVVVLSYHKINLGRLMLKLVK